jgi:hypothetical protein
MDLVHHMENCPKEKHGAEAGYGEYAVQESRGTVIDKAYVLAREVSEKASKGQGKVRRVQ